MDLRPSFSAVLAAFGVDATVTVPSGSPVATRVVWMPPLSLDYPPTGELRRLEAKRVLAIPTSEVPKVPVKTEIVAPEYPGATVATWTVDSIDHYDYDHVRVIVLREMTT